MLTVRGVWSRTEDGAQLNKCRTFFLLLFWPIFANAQQYGRTACVLVPIKNGDVTTVRRKIRHTSHDMILEIPGCKSVVVVTPVQRKRQARVLIHRRNGSSPAAPISRSLRSTSAPNTNACGTAGFATNVSSMKLTRPSLEV